MRMYFGTSELRAPLLAGMGWPHLLMHINIDSARQQACHAAVQDLSRPVVLYLDVGTTASGPTAVGVGPCQLEVEEVVEGDTAEARLGFSEQAGVGSEVINGLIALIDETHKLIRKNIDVGGGASAEIPSLQDLRHAVRQLRGVNPYTHEEYYAQDEEDKLAKVGKKYGKGNPSAEKEMNDLIENQNLSKDALEQWAKKYGAQNDVNKVIQGRETRITREGKRHSGHHKTVKDVHAHSRKIKGIVKGKSRKGGTFAAPATNKKRQVPHMKHPPIEKVHAPKHGGGLFDMFKSRKPHPVTPKAEEVPPQGAPPKEAPRKRQAKAPPKEAPARNYDPQKKKPDTSGQFEKKRSGMDMELRGTLNGKPMTITILRGSEFRVHKTPQGTALWRPGMRGHFIISPSDAGKVQ